MMEEETFKMELTKDQVEWVINQKDTQEKLSWFQNEQEEWKLYHKKTVEEWRRLFTIVGIEVSKPGVGLVDMNTFWDRLEEKFERNREQE
jgi:hypothetical protein